MLRVRHGLGLAGLLASLAACQSVVIDNEAALQARSLEVQLDASGLPVEIEYHCESADVPQAVHDAMTELHGEGEDVGAEREWLAGVQDFEFVREVDGLAVEAMFTADGQLHAEEVEVRREDVPAAVVDAAAARWPQGRVSSWEVVRDGRRQLVAYHVKVSDGGRRYKAAVSADGVVTGVWRELEAEIEVPLD